MSETMIGAVLQTFGAAVFGYLIARYTMLAQLKVRKIQFIENSVELLSLHKDTPNSVRVLIKDFEEKEGIDDPEKDIEIRSANAHSIRFKNKGNDVARDVSFEIEFERSSRIISRSTSPSTSESYEIKFDVVKDRPNIARLTLPYLNPKQEVRANIVRTLLDKNESTIVRGYGEGIEISRFKQSGFVLPMMIFMAFAFLLLLVFDTATDGLGGVVSQDWIEFLGGRIETREAYYADFPTAHKFAVVLLGGLALAASIYRAIVKHRF